jgi:hypothetical protein
MVSTPNEIADAGQRSHEKQFMPVYSLRELVLLSVLNQKKILACIGSERWHRIPWLSRSSLISLGFETENLLTLLLF